MKSKKEIVTRIHEAFEEWKSNVGGVTSEEEEAAIELVAEIEALEWVLDEKVITNWDESEEAEEDDE